jgi:hypothetical protein
MIEYLAINYNIMNVIGIIGITMLVIALAIFYVHKSKNYIMIIFGFILSSLALLSPSRDYYCYVVKNHNEEFCNDYFNMQKVHQDLVRHGRR